MPLRDHAWPPVSKRSSWEGPPQCFPSCRSSHPLRAAEPGRQGVNHSSPSESPRKFFGPSRAQSIGEIGTAAAFAVGAFAAKATAD